MSEAKSEDVVVDDENVCCKCLPCRHGKKVESNPHFLPYHERGCTNLICFIIFALALAAWAAVAFLAFSYGKPDILNHAMDSQGNICGIAGSEVHDVYNDKGERKTKTNSFEYAMKDGKETGGTMPKSLTVSKYGIFPRIADDLVSQAHLVSQGTSGLQKLKFTQLCVDKCPSAGETVCSYMFLAKYESYFTKNNFNTSNPVNDPLVRSMMRHTSGVTRSIALQNPYFLEKACSKYAKSALLATSDDALRNQYDMCIDSFIGCDSVPAPSKSILGRCVPYIELSDEVETQRCIEPLSDIPCDPLNETGWDISGADSDFNTQCMKNPDDGKFYEARYVPAKVVKKGKASYPLTSEGEKYCVRMERKKLQIQAVIPQMEYLSSLTAVAGTVAQYMGDIRTAWYVCLAAGLVFPLVFSFVYTVIMRFCAGVMVWLALVLFIIFTIALGIVALLKGGTIDVSVVDAALNSAGQTSASSYSVTNVSQDYGMYYQIIGYCLLVGALIAICMCVFLRRTINNAIHIIQISAKALAQNFALTLFPVISFLGIAATASVFIVIGVLLLTAGNITESSLVNQTSADAVNTTSAAAVALLNANKPQIIEGLSTLNYLMFFDLFMFLWTTEFIQAIGIMVIGGTVSHWYFGATTSEIKPTAEHHGQSHRCCCSWWIALRFHMGSAAFGSCLIAVVTCLRAAFEYIDHQMKQHSENNSCMMKAFRCIIRCCLCCLERCIRFISKNSYIHTSMKGDGFCFAAVRSYRLIFRHLLSFGATNTITSILMIIGKMMVCVSSMLVSYSWVTYDPQFTNPQSPTYLSSTLFISIIVLTMAYLVAESFFNVFHVCIDTVLMCYCMDMENGGTCRRQIVSAKMEKLGKSADTKVPVAEKPGWFTANENKKDGFIARCC